VAEHLNKDSLSRKHDSGDRHKSRFKEDKAIPLPFRARLKDYVGSEFDRGHLVPAADVHGTQEKLDETFLCKFYLI
jgi:endonuclease G